MLPLPSAIERLSLYHCKYTNLVVGLHTQGEFEGQIIKAQPISNKQLEFLRELNILD